MLYGTTRENFYLYPCQPEIASGDVTTDLLRVDEVANPYLQTPREAPLELRLA
jgi:hypothetical protein